MQANRSPSLQRLPPDEEVSKPLNVGGSHRAARHPDRLLSLAIHPMYRILPVRQSKSLRQRVIALPSFNVPCVAPGRAVPLRCALKAMKPKPSRERP